MADYVKTITNGINIFGMGASTKWGDANGAGFTMVWGTSKWGEGSFRIVFSASKLISNSQVLDSTIIKLAEVHVNDSLVLDSAISKDAQITVLNSMTLSEDMYSEKLSLEGWNYIFPSNTNEGESRISTTWATSSQSTQSYTCQTVSTTTWV